MKKYLIFFAALSLSLSLFAQGHFLVAFEGDGLDHMNLNILGATIDGKALKSGDEIAVFDGTICCGKVILTQSIVSDDPSTFVTIAASRADAGVANGYTEGHPILFKFWDSARSQEVSGVIPLYYDINTMNQVYAPTFKAYSSAFAKLSFNNHPPTANAGPDFSVNEGQLATLDGSLSGDPDGNAITYSWTAPTGIKLSSTTSAQPTFTAPEVAVDTKYTFSLIVNDGKISSTTDQVVVTVKQINKAPVANAGNDQSKNENTLVTLDGSGSFDADGDPLTYTWTAPPGISLNAVSAQKPTFTAPEVQSNTAFTFSLVVNDGKANSAADQVVINVLQVNKPPTANAGTDQIVKQGTLVTLDGTQSVDPDQDALTYKWNAPGGITLSSSTASKPTFTAPKVSVSTNYTFSLVVNDGKTNSNTDNVVITVIPDNFPPVANAGPDQTVNEGTLVTLNGTASTDGDGDALTYQWTAPAGISLSSTTASKPTFTAPEVSVNTNYTFSLIVNDGKISSVSDQVMITVRQVNKVPVANAGPDQVVDAGAVVTLNATGSYDGDGEPITYRWTAPAGITLSSPTAAQPIFTAPQVNANTDYLFSLVVSDGTSNSAADQILVTVRQTNRSPVANAGTDQTVPEGTLVLLDGTGSTDADGDALTYQWSAPSGINLSSTTASRPTFTAPEVTATTNYTVSLVVNDGKTNSTADQLVVTVLQVNKPPVANAGPDQTVNEGGTVQLTGLASSDPDHDNLTYQWTAPPGISISSPSSPTPAFVAPEVSADTDFAISLVVNDGATNSTADQVIVRVRQVNKAPIANAGLDFTATEGKTVQLDGTLSYDPDLESITYSWIPPAGITLNSGNTSHPTFVAPAVSVSTDFTFKLTVGDGKVSSVADQVVVTIVPNRAPVANAGADLFVKEMSLFTLDGSASFDPDGDPITYKWTAPAGILLTSSTEANPSFITPKISQAATLTFTLVVNDGKKDSPPDQVVLTLKSGNTAPIANAGKDQTVNEGDLVNLDGGNSFDPDGDALVFSWTTPSEISLNTASGVTPHFIAPEVMSDTPFVVELKVNDGTVSSAADQVLIVVKQVNKPPTANAGPDQIVDEGSQVMLDASHSSDPDNDQLTYKWVVPGSISLSSSTDPRPTFTAPEVSANQTFDLALIVNDGKVNSVIDHVLITVRQVNKAPVANAGPDQQVAEGSLVNLNGSGSFDPDNDGLNFFWTAPPGITLSSASEINPTFVAPEVSVNTPYIFYLVVSDGILNSVTDQVTIVIKQQNKIPLANAGSNQTVYEGTLITLDGSASADPDNDPLNYRWNAPPGIVLSSTTDPTPTFSAPSVVVNTDYVFTLTVSDGQSSSASSKVVVTVKPLNKRPVANAGMDQTVDERSLVLLDGTSSFDPDQWPITYKWVSPQGIVLSSDHIPTPNFMAPDVAATTNFVFVLVVSDGVAESPPDSVSVTIRQVNQPPVYKSFDQFSANQGENFEFILNTDDPDHDAVAISVADLPSFIALTKTSETSAILSGKASAQNVGTYRLTAQLSDGFSTTAQTITITITENDHAPYVVNPLTDVSVSTGSAPLLIDLTQVFKDDDPGDVLQYRVFSNSDPEIVDAGVSGNELFLNFSAAASGNAEVMVAAFSNGKNAVSAFHVEVKDPTLAVHPELAPKIQVYPNPTSGLLSLNFDRKPKEGTVLTVFDASGKKIRQYQVKDLQQQIDLSHQRPGTYFLKFSDWNYPGLKVIRK